MSEVHDMKLSIVVPVYNCEAFLESCVNSLLKLAGIDLEILLIDDGSTDGSGLLCDRLQSLHPSVRCFHQVNQGVSAARNLGIRMAQGDYLMFVDADDTLDHAEFAAFFSEFLRLPSVDIALFGMRFDYYYRGENYRRETLQAPSAYYPSSDAWKEQVSALYARNYLSTACNKLIRRRLLPPQELRFDEAMFLLEDLEFSLRCLARCGPVYVSDRVVYQYRQSEDEGNAKRRLKRIRRVSALIDQLQPAFASLAGALCLEPHGFDRLLTSIFLMLAREKVRVSTLTELRELCDDFSAWTMKNNIPASFLKGRLAGNLLRRRILSLILRDQYSKYRHSFANLVKYLKYRKSKGKQAA